MDEKRIELKPCPFCGNASGREPDKYGVYVWQERRFDQRFKKGKWIAECRNCGVDTGCEDTQQEAIASWNTRVPILFDDRVREAARVALDALWNIIYANDLAFERNQSLKSWKDSDFRREGDSAYHALKRALAGEGKQASPADAEAFAQAEREFNAGETVPEASVPEAQGVVERVCEAYGRVALATAREHDRERHDDYVALEHRANALAEAIRNFPCDGCNCEKCNRVWKALAAYEKGKQA